MEIIKLESIYEESRKALLNVTYKSNDSDKVNSKMIIRYSEIKKVWPDFSLSATEGFTAECYGKYAYAHINIAQGQGTFLVIWDIEEDKMIHISSCSHGIKSVISEGYIYTLCDVCQWGCKPHLCVEKTKIGVMNRWEEGDSLDFKIDYEPGTKVNYDNMFINIEGDEIVAGYDDVAARCAR